jgi:protocatechuate 3,4-dioxygenase beta subunit
MEKQLGRKISRRELLGMMGAVGAAAVVGCDDDDGGSPEPTATQAAAPSATTSALATRTPAPSSLDCVVSPEMVEGPFFLDEQVNRSDIREDSEGVPVRLRITIYDVEGEACTPLAGVIVDVWHCDAAGVYSGVEQNGTDETFLRGYQITDDAGAVEFTTVYPGWYTGRAVHIHMKVRTEPESDQGFEFTSQLFFDDALTDQVYTQAPYNTRGTPDTRNDVDSIYRSGGAQMLLTLSENNGGYAGSIRVGVQRA